MRSPLVVTESELSWHDPSSGRSLNLERFPDGSLEMYIDEGRSDYDHPNNGVASIQIDTDHAADVLVAIQVWIEQLTMNQEER